MRHLQFKVDAQVLNTSEDLYGLVPGTEGYLVANFDFSNEWNGCVKIASFFTRKGTEYAKRLTNDRCFIPKEVLEDKMFKVQVVGVKHGYKILTNVLKIRQGR